MVWDLEVAAYADLVRHRIHLRLKSALVGYENNFVDKVFEKHKNLSELKFTNFKLDYIQYIVSVHNNNLLSSCITNKKLEKGMNSPFPI
jgi:hypothetical protein